ncbi:hypothetical protein PHMEG_00013911 [Phytophthora megakarya]|uniref:Integrase catalytic domain-containing protein n=1 Tax=Phytophthora megakarya TaxID=4795 RepID=A0A225W545_9STRA|nr:hypothetical protein PHMEG_00013911 [Phytophthora megakarya]
MNYHPAEKEVLALLLLLKTCYTQLAGRTLHVYTRFSTLEWITKFKSLLERAAQWAVLLSPWHLIVQRIKEKDCAFTRLLQPTVTNFVDIDDSLELVAPPQNGSPTSRIDPQLLYAKLPLDYSGLVVPFDGSAKTEKNGGYGSCAWVVWRLPEWTIVLAASAYLESTTVNVAEYTGMNNGVRAALELGADNLEVVGDSRLAIQQYLGVSACRKETLVAQLNYHKELTSKLKSVKYLHILKEFNAAADSLATEVLESKTSKVVLDERRKLELAGLNRIPEVIYDSSQTRIEVKPVTEDSNRSTSTISTSQSKPFADFVQTAQKQSTSYVLAVTRSQATTQKKRVRFADDSVTTPQAIIPKPMSTEDTENVAVNPAKNGANALSMVPDASDFTSAAIQSERRRRIAIAQDEEIKWLNLKTVLGGNPDILKYRAARDAWNIAERFLLTDDNVLYYMHSTPRNQQDNQDELRLRLVVPTTMIQEVLQNNHDSLKGGSEDIPTSEARLLLVWHLCRRRETRKVVSKFKSKPQLRGYSPGNILAERPFQIVSIGFVIPLPKSRRGNTTLLLFQCAFTGFVIPKPMSDTTAFKVAQVFEECIYRRVGAPSLIRHDRDPRYMGEIFQGFAEMMQSISRATLSYRPQTNGQQERSVKTVMRSVKFYAEDPLQQDWDEIAEHLVFAINNSMDTTR